VFNYLTLRAILASLDAARSRCVRPVDDPKAVALPDRPAGPRATARSRTCEEGRHADDGRRADHVAILWHAAVGGPRQPLRLDRARRDRSRSASIGFVDDYLKLVVGNAAGLIARYKYFWQSLAGLSARRCAVLHGARIRPTTTLPAVLQELRAAARHARLHVCSSYLMIVGMSNAVNLTDGLDGLAIMPAVMVAGALGIFAYASGNASSPYLGIPACRAPARC
jgi:hypothetical protein